MTIRTAKRTDLEKIAILSRECFPEKIASSEHNVQMRYYKDPTSYIVATDIHDNPIAYMCVIPLSKFMYDRLVSVSSDKYYGESMDIIYCEKESDMMLLQSVAIHPDHRDGDIIVFLGEELDKKIAHKKCVAEVTSPDGAKFCERHGFLKHKETKGGFSVWRYPNKF
ncbi:MAG: hypothetical protein IIZ61_00715 [Lachnospiraceae bacterium]|nr:hypothetical protein [Lachnospiraceae bacterium]